MALQIKRAMFGIIKYDYQFNYINDVKLKSDESVSISDFAFKNEKLWICGESKVCFLFKMRRYMKAY